MDPVLPELPSFQMKAKIWVFMWIMLIFAFWQMLNAKTQQALCRPDSAHLKVGLACVPPA
jgi:hypothetical protein